MEQIMVNALTEGGKLAAKVGSKVVCYVGGTLVGYGVSQAVMPHVRKSMEKYMTSEEWSKLTPEQQQKEIMLYNVEATALNGLCNAVGAVVSLLADTAATKAIYNSNATGNYSSFTIGNNYII